MQIKAAVRYHHATVKMAPIWNIDNVNTGEDVEQREPSLIIGRNASGIATLKDSLVGSFLQSKMYS